MRLTRRKLASGLVAAAAAAQTAPPPIPQTPDEELKIAREQVQRTGETLRKLEVPMAAEPAFLFKA